jgi:DNA-binding SARP family transcriptional activator
MLAARHIGVALLPDGRAIPLMKISTLGHLSLSLEGRAVQSENLTPAMRELLALIISCPDMKMYQEEILASLWPDIPPTKARSRFDTLLLELRRILKAAFGNNGLLDHYLVLKRGMLCLLNCRLDADRFAELARKGLAHARNREFWQAGNCFHSASLRWQGPYLAGIRGKDRVNSRGYELDRLYHDMSVMWGRILLDAGRYGESVDVLNRALKQDCTNDQLVSALYRAYLHNHQPIRANELLRQYEEALRAAEYEPDEIEDSLQAIWK